MLERRQIVLEERFRLAMAKNVTYYFEADRLEREGNETEAVLVHERSDRWLRLQRRVEAALHASRAATARMQTRM
jgi:hypothetical protein